MKMTTWIALIRGINVGGRKKLAMEDLRGLLAEMDLADVKTLLQSGNVLFNAATRSAAELEGSLEGQTRKRLGIEVDFLVRSQRQWETIVAQNPSPNEAKRDPAHLAMMCLKGPPSKTRMADLTRAIDGRELVRAVGAQLYIVYPDGIGQSTCLGPDVRELAAVSTKEVVERCARRQNGWGFVSRRSRKGLLRRASRAVCPRGRGRS